MHKPELYLETSAWNFFFADDAPEKRDITKEFFDSIRAGTYEIFVSDVVLREIGNAPEEKKVKLFSLIETVSPAQLDVTDEAIELADLYLFRKVVPVNKRDDALHVAVATVYEMDALISWNFKHLANLRKTDLFYGINLEKGYGKRLNIITPMEVSENED